MLCTLQATAEEGKRKKSGSKQYEAGSFGNS
jgi:hypothetical protein